MLLQRSEEKIAKIIGTYQFRKEEPRYSRRVCCKLAIFCLWPLPLDRVSFAAPPCAMSALHSANSNIRPKAEVAEKKSGRSATFDVRGWPQASPLDGGDSQHLSEPLGF